LQEWELVLDKITSIERNGTKEVTIADFERLMENNFSRRGMVEGFANAIKTSETVSKDMRNIASDLGDFKQVSTLLEPYLLSPGISLSKLRKGGERIKREFSEKRQELEKLNSLRDGNDVDALFAFITREDPAAKQPKKSKKKQERNKKTVAIDSKMHAEPCLDAAMSSVIEITHPVAEVAGEINQLVIHTEADSLLAASEEEMEGAFDFTPDYFKYEKPKPFTTNNPKFSRQCDKEAGLAVKISADDAAVEKSEVSEPSLTLKPSHKSILQSILSVASHPPKWRKALSAVSSVISQLGGSFNGSLGKGSSVEFWIGGVRFLVDNSHGSDHEMMYPDQMVFMKKGLERAGITLDLLSGL
jgi:hypothetical protein